MRHAKLCLSVIMFLICVCWHPERMCKVLSTCGQRGQVWLVESLNNTAFWFMWDGSNGSSNAPRRWLSGMSKKRATLLQESHLSWPNNQMPVKPLLALSFFRHSHYHSPVTFYKVKSLWYYWQWGCRPPSTQSSSQSNLWHFSPASYRPLLRPVLAKRSKQSWLLCRKATSLD